MTVFPEEPVGPGAKTSLSVTLLCISMVCARSVSKGSPMEPQLSRDDVLPDGRWVTVTIARAEVLGVGGGGGGSSLQASICFIIFLHHNSDAGSLSEGEAWCLETTLAHPASGCAAWREKPYHRSSRLVGQGRHDLGLLSKERKSRASRAHDSPSQVLSTEQKRRGGRLLHADDGC